MHSAFMFCSTPALPVNAAQAIAPKSVSLTANRNDTEKTLIHIYFQKFCFAGAKSAP
jgi:hypothetical protein